MRIAVVGAGLSGLAAAWWLAKAGHHVTLHERHEAPGFTAHSLAVEGALRGERVDVPLRVFYPGYYPTLMRLYAELGAASEPVSYAGSFIDEQRQLYFRYRNLRWGDRSIGTWAPQDALLGPRAWRIGAGLLRLRSVVQRLAAQQQRQGLPTIGELAEAEGLSTDLVEGFLLPVIATISTCTLADARQFPADVVLGYITRGLASQAVRRACGGADAVQARLVAGIPELRCRARIAAVRPEATAATLHHEDGRTEIYDHVVLATQANQALALLAAPSHDEARLLGSFGYVPVHVVTHRDPRVMPRRPRDWSPVNLQLLPGSASPVSTIWVNAVQPALREAHDVFQTVAPAQPLRDVIGEAQFERPVVTADSAAAWSGLERLAAQPSRRIWFCGAYAASGIPLLESAVRSARDVVERIAAAVAATQAGLRADISV